MSRLIDSFEQILDGSGNPLEFGLLDFFVSGSSDVRRKTYADAAETIENSNPVVLGGDGRCPNVFGTGTYNVILRTAAGAQLLARDPVGGSDSLTFGADWVASTSYSATDQVRDDGNYWQSVTNLNQGNQPSLNDGSNWLKTDFLNITVNTSAIAVNTSAIAVLDSEKMPKTGGAFSGQVTSTAGDFNLVVNTALSDAAATLTASQLIGGEFTITPTAARIQTLDTAANIISALSGSVTGSNFTFTIVNLAAFDVTIATAAGVTLVGNMIVNNGSATFRVRRLSGSTISVTRAESISLPKIAGSTVFTQSTNNIGSTGIGSIGLAVGDVITVTDTSSNNKYFTVEVITDANNVIVNQAHAGGTTTKSLVDETSSATVTLLCRALFAPAGLGQGYVNMSSSRSGGVTYTSLPTRSMFISFLVNISTSRTLTVDSSINFTAVSSSVRFMTSVLLAPAATYIIDGGASTWNELR
jgi:hypothetical protein